MCCQNSSDPGYQNRQSGKQFKHCLAQSFSVFLSFSIRHIHSFYRSIRSGKLDHALQYFLTGTAFIDNDQFAGGIDVHDRTYAQNITY